MTARLDAPAPPLVLNDQQGETFDLASLQGESVAVVFFYPGDFTPGCTAESCAFRDAYEDFVDAGAVVIGVSADSESSHARFANRFSLPYTLLSDEGGRVRDAWDVPKSLGFMPGRVTYVIDQQGVVRHTFSSQLNVFKHVKEALAVVKRLRDAAA